MRAKPMAVLMSLMCACSAGDLTDSSGPLSLTVSQSSVAPGGALMARVTNGSRRPFSTYVELPCGSPFERQVGRTWVRLQPPTTICEIGAVFQTLGPGSAWNYSWSAPSDTGTYRATITLGPVILVSHPIVVR
jgi:hypothetical protein